MNKMAFEAFFPIGTYSRWIFKFGSWHALLWNLPHFGSGSRPLFESEPFHTEELLILSEKNVKNTSFWNFAKIMAHEENSYRRLSVFDVPVWYRYSLLPLFLVIWIRISDPYLFTKLVNADSIWIRIHNTGSFKFVICKKKFGVELKETKNVFYLRPLSTECHCCLPFGKTIYEKQKKLSV